VRLESNGKNYSGEILSCEGFELTMIFDSFNQNPRQSKLSYATVHQFQGSEKDAIIFDCVDSYRQVKPGVLLTVHKNNNSLRLINVAVTRTRGKSIAVANRNYWNNKLPLTGSILRNLLDYLKEKGAHCFRNNFVNPCCSNTQSLRNLKAHNGLDCMYSLLGDISTAKAEILMDIPKGSVLNEEELTNALEDAQKRGVKVLLRAEKPHTLSSKLSKLCHVQPFAWSPVTVIDSRIS